MGDCARRERPSFGNPPVMRRDMMHVRVDDQGAEDVSVEQPPHRSSASILATSSAVIGNAPRTVGNPSRRFVVRRCGSRARRRSLFTAALMEQSSALARERATAYRSSSSEMLSRMHENLMQWCTRVKHHFTTSHRVASQVAMIAVYGANDEPAV